MHATYRAGKTICEECLPRRQPGERPPQGSQSAVAPPIFTSYANGPSKHLTRAEVVAAFPGVEVSTDYGEWPQQQAPAEAADVAVVPHREWGDGKGNGSGGMPR